jgi:hypothetical protein
MLVWICIADVEMASILVEERGGAGCGLVGVDRRMLLVRAGLLRAGGGLDCS